MTIYAVVRRFRRKRANRTLLRVAIIALQVVAAFGLLLAITSAARASCECPDPCPGVCVGCFCYVPLPNDPV